MKPALCLLILLGMVRINAQTVSSQAPIRPATADGTRTWSANRASSSPALAVPSSMRAGALMDALAGFGFTNQFGTNFTSADLASALAALQDDLQQVLALLDSFNGNFIAGAGTMRVAEGYPNFAQDLATSAGRNLATNFAQSLAVPGNPWPTPAVPWPAQAPGPATALATPIVSTNVLGVPVATTSNGFMAVSSSVRLLFILQNDIERMLPEVAVATGNPFVLPVWNGTVENNNVGILPSQLDQLGIAANNADTGTPRIPARINMPQRLTPTGR